MDLRTMFAALLLVITLLLSGVFYGGLEYYEGQAREQSRTNLEETTDLAARQISATAEERMDYVGLVASRPEAARFNRSELYLDNLLDSTRFFAAQTVAANGTVVAFRGAIDQTVRQGVVGSDVSDEPYFSKALNRSAFMSRPEYVNTTDQHLVVISAPIFDDGELVGVLAASVYLTDDTLFTSLVPVGTMDRRVEVSADDAVLYRDGGRIEVGTTARATVEPVGWTLAVTQDQSDLNARLQGLALAQGAGLVIVLSSVFAFGVWEYRGNLQQTRRLLDGFERLREGAYGTRLELSTAEEWQRIAEGFNELAAGLTEREAAILEREQRLQVLNRVLRHNLRNDINVVLMSAELVRRFADDERARRAAENAIEVCERLIRTGGKARRLEALLEHSTPQPIDLVPVVESAVERLGAEYPGVRVELSVPESATAMAVPGIAFAIENLCENAVMHGGDEPTVRVECRRLEGPEPVIEVVVGDDGPGLPEHEREVLAEGAETPLDHGSGLGLWAVQWVVENSRGSVGFETGQGGTTVRLRLPAADRFES
jgi:signal transduction histidine kinase